MKSPYPPLSSHIPPKPSLLKKKKINKIKINSLFFSICTCTMSRDFLVSRAKKATVLLQVIQLPPAPPIKEYRGVETETWNSNMKNLHTGHTAYRYVKSPRVFRCFFWVESKMDLVRWKETKDRRWMLPCIFLLFENLKLLIYIGSFFKMHFKQFLFLIKKTSYPIFY